MFILHNFLQLVMWLVTLSFRVFMSSECGNRASQHFTTSDDVFINEADAVQRECVTIEQDLTYVLKWKLKKCLHAQSSKSFAVYSRTLLQG